MHIEYKQKENKIESSNIVIENSTFSKKKMQFKFLYNCFYCTEYSLFKCLVANEIQT